MNINDIKANMKTGFARPNLFRVRFGGVKASKQLPFIINCFQAQIPGTNILTSDRDIGLRQVAYQRAYADMMIGFYCSGDLLELALFQEWMDTIVNPLNNHMGYYHEYASTVQIEQLKREGGGGTGGAMDESITCGAENKVAGIWTLHEAFPKQVDPVQLDYGTNDIYMMVSLTLTYRRFTVEFKKDIGPQIAQLSDYEKELGRKDYQYTDPATGAYIPNPKTGKWSNASQGFAGGQ